MDGTSYGASYGSYAAVILRGKHADAKETDQEPYGCDVIRIVIRLICRRDPERESMRTQKETDQEPYDVTAIRLLRRLMILSGKACGRKGDGSGAV